MIYVTVTLKTPHYGNGFVSFVCEEEKTIEEAIDAIITAYSEFYGGKVELVDIKKEYGIKPENLISDSGNLLQ